MRFASPPRAAKQRAPKMNALRGGMTRVALTPEWVAIIDFEQRFPSAIEQAMATASAGAA